MGKLTSPLDIVYVVYPLWSTCSVITQSQGWHRLGLHGKLTHYIMIISSNRSYIFYPQAYIIVLSPEALPLEEPKDDITLGYNVHMSTKVNLLFYDYIIKQPIHFLPPGLHYRAESGGSVIGRTQRRHRAGLHGQHGHLPCVHQVLSQTQHPY